MDIRFYGAAGRVYLAGTESEVKMSEPAKKPLTEPTKGSLLVLFLTVFIDLLGFGLTHPLRDLPVQDERLIGIVTEHDFMRIAGQLLEEMLRE